VGFDAWGWITKNSSLFLSIICLLSLPTSEGNLCIGKRQMPGKRLIWVKLLTIAVAFSAGPFLRAASIAWSADHIDNWSKVANDTGGPLLEALNFGGGPTTVVNGVEFGSVAAGGAGGTYILLPSLPRSDYNHQSTYYTGPLTDPAGDDLFDYMAWSSANTGTNYTYTLQGLTPGKTYMVQFLHSDDRTTADWFQVFDLGTATEFGDAVTTSHNAQVDPLIVTGLFTADDTIQTFTTHSNGSPAQGWHCSAIQLREFIPLKAYGPSPANGARGISAFETILSWMPGTYVASHNVYFGTDYFYNAI
jgi:hypothetical protein